MSVVGLYFRRRRPVALGLTAVGGALGPVILPQILRWSMTVYSWRGVFIFLATFTMQCCVFGALLRPVKYIVRSPLSVQKYETGRRNATWREITNYRILANPTFCIQIVNNLLWCTAISQLWILLPDYANESNMSKSQGAMLVSIASIGNVLGRGSAAVAMHLFPNMDRLQFHNISTIFGGLFLALYAVEQKFYFFAPVTCSFGLLNGLLVGSLAVVTSDLYGIDMLTSAYGYLMVADGLGFALGPPFAGKNHRYVNVNKTYVMRFTKCFLMILGWMFEMSKDYDMPFIVAGIIYTLSGVIMYLTMLKKKN